MNEAAWNTCTELDKMLAFLQGRTSDRKLRLFAVACCRSVEKRLPQDPCMAAVEMSERFADGLVRSRDLELSRADVNDVPANRRERCDGGMDAYAAALHVVSGNFLDTQTTLLVAEHTSHLGMEGVLDSDDANAWLRHWAACRAIDFARDPAALQEALHEYQNLSRTQCRPRQCHLLRDIIGNPFRSPPALDVALLAWNDGTVQRLAAAAYEHRLPSGRFDQERLGVLADAMEEAGGHASLLEHLRQPGPHVRGCHVVDALLGRS